MWKLSVTTLNSKTGSFWSFKPICLMLSDHFPGFVSSHPPSPFMNNILCSKPSLSLTSASEEQVWAVGASSNRQKRLFNPESILLLIFSLNWHPSLWVKHTSTHTLDSVSMCVSVTLQSNVLPLPVCFCSYVANVNTRTTWLEPQAGNQRRELGN